MLHLETVENPLNLLLNPMAEGVTARGYFSLLGVRVILGFVKSLQGVRTTLDFANNLESSNEEEDRQIVDTEGILNGDNCSIGFFVVRSMIEL